MAKTIQIEIPDGFEALLSSRATDRAQLAKWSLEALVIEAYREGIISRGKIGELLGLSFDEREIWLAQHDIPYILDGNDLDKDKAAIAEIFGR